MRCGKELEVEGRLGPGEEKFCYKHPKVATQLACGRCDRPVCTKCVVLGPAGPRCKECAKLNFAVRPEAVLHEVKSGFRGLFRGGPWAIYMYIVLIGLALSAFRGCSDMMRTNRRQVQPEHLNRDAKSADEPTSQQ